MTAWEHESLHAVYFAEHFNKTELMIQASAWICVPDACEKYRSKFVSRMESAFDFEMDYRNAQLHGTDYPPGQQAGWCGAAKGFATAMQNKLSEAAAALVNLAACMAAECLF